VTRKHFTIWHSLEGLGILLIVEYVLLQITSAAWMPIIFIAAAGGAIGTTYVSTQVIEEVKSAWHMLILLSLTTTEFVIFFAFEYWFLIQQDPGSFLSLSPQPVTLLLHSVMTFVFNPIYLPADLAGQGLLLINTLGALGLVLFLLQNIGQFRKNSGDAKNV